MPGEEGERRNEYPLCALKLFWKSMLREFTGRAGIATPKKETRDARKGSENSFHEEKCECV